MSSLSIKIENLSKRFFIISGRMTTFQLLLELTRGNYAKDELWALRNLNLEVKRGEKLALVGKNGSGKTMLLRILSGIYDATSGSFIVNGRMQVLLNMNIGINADLSVLDNIFLFGAIYGLTREQLSKRIDSILDVSELGDQRHVPFKELSLGQQQRFSLSVFFCNESEILLFDENFRDVDQGFIKKCDEYFKKIVDSDRTMIMTSHDHSVLRRYCHQALWLENGQVRQAGVVDEVMDAYEESL